ncbi:hypothetical protein B0J12DRAFT_726737 [Macrophomina phaseolina]|uniref:Uncharacterized protein n=1 Tax=Macrophomina phaseolina TaxID=35725 RepID=A0ABQ8GH42_9PEZI|nr:hypothetical protein B0J12DRAFT_726737 [Macrophomina phaseolina]
MWLSYDGVRKADHALNTAPEEIHDRATDSDVTSQDLTSPISSSDDAGPSTSNFSPFFHNAQRTTYNLPTSSNTLPTNINATQQAPTHDPIRRAIIAQIQTRPPSTSGPTSDLHLCALMIDQIRANARILSGCRHTYDLAIGRGADAGYRALLFRHDATDGPADTRFASLRRAHALLRLEMGRTRGEAVKGRQELDDWRCRRCLRFADVVEFRGRNSDGSRGVGPALPLLWKAEVPWNANAHSVTILKYLDVFGGKSKKKRDSVGKGEMKLRRAASGIFVRATWRLSKLTSHAGPWEHQYQMDYGVEEPISALAESNETEVSIRQSQSAHEEEFACIAPKSWCCYCSRLWGKLVEWQGPPSTSVARQMLSYLNCMLKANVSLAEAGLGM